MTAETTTIPAPAAAVAIDVTDRANPAVILRLISGGMTTDLRIAVGDAEKFAADVAGAIVGAARQAIAQTGTALITPPTAGGLFVPGRRP